MTLSNATTTLAAAVLLTLLSLTPAAAQDDWNPFADRDSRPARDRGGWPSAPDRAPPPGQWQPDPRIYGGDRPSGNAPAAVERSDLPPVIANDGSGLPFDLWQGLDLATVEQVMSLLALPSPSPTMQKLWLRLMTATSGEPSGATPAAFAAVRVEGLYRAGMLEPIADALAAAGRAGNDPILEALGARRAIAIGQREAGCSGVRSSAARKGDLPPVLRGEMLVLAGYCAAAAGNVSAASLAAELAREEGVKDAITLNALEAVAEGRQARIPREGRIGPTQYRLMELAKSVDPAAVLQNGDAPLISALVLDPATDDRLRLAAAEWGARSHVISPAQLAGAWRAQRFAPMDLANALESRGDPLSRRAQLFQAAEIERHPGKRVRVLRALLDDARRGGFYVTALAAVAPLVGPPQRGPDTAWLGELAIEAALASGDLGAAHAWASALDGSGEGRPRSHWLALVDIADPNLRGVRGYSLSAVEAMAAQGRFSAPVLHRLATVLDALNYQVPMGLWQMASSTPQPNDGHLPATGVLSQLQGAAKSREFARTVLLAMATLGPNGAEGAHIIALGDTIRALRQLGLEGEARRIGFEALFAAWPRLASN